MSLRFPLLCSALFVLCYSTVAEACTCDVSASSPVTVHSAEITRPQFEPETAHLDYASLRGVSLDMTAGEVQQAVDRLGFLMLSPSSADAAMDICNGQTRVGTIRFDANQRVVKLELSPLYFSVGRVHLREFADAVFDKYRVTRAQMVDDVCYADVTCFRGTTLAEQFLIVRITADVQLHVSKRMRPSLTQD
jgi:hypothetical protein